MPQHVTNWFTNDWCNLQITMKRERDSFAKYGNSKKNKNEKKEASDAVRTQSTWTIRMACIAGGSKQNNERRHDNEKNESKKWCLNLIGVLFQKVILRVELRLPCPVKMDSVLSFCGLIYSFIHHGSLISVPQSSHLKLGQKDKIIPLSQWGYHFDLRCIQTVQFNHISQWAESDLITAVDWNQFKKKLIHSVSLNTVTGLKN